MGRRESALKSREALQAEVSSRTFRLRRSYLSATARRAQHYSVSTPLKLNTFCPSHSTLLTLNNLVFNNNEFNTTSIQHYFNSTTLHLKKKFFNNLTFNTTYIQQSHFQQSHFQQSHIKHPSHSTILVSLPQSSY